MASDLLQTPLKVEVELPKQQPLHASNPPSLPLASCSVQPHLGIHSLDSLGPRWFPCSLLCFCERSGMQKLPQRKALWSQIKRMVFTVKTLHACTRLCTIQVHNGRVSYRGKGEGIPKLYFLPKISDTLILYQRWMLFAGKTFHSCACLCSIEVQRVHVLKWHKIHPLGQNGSCRDRGPFSQCECGAPIRWWVHLLAGSSRSPPLPVCRRNMTGSHVWVCGGCQSTYRLLLPNTTD